LKNVEMYWFTKKRIYNKINKYLTHHPFLFLG